jgi:hypothetical protein
MKSFLSILLAVFISASSSSVCAAGSAPEGGASIDRDKLIDQLLAVSGMRDSLEKLPSQAAFGLMQAAVKSQATPEEGREFVQTLKEAFPKDVFVDSVRAAMEKNYNERRYARLLHMMSTPLSKRMTQVETQTPQPAEVQNFLAQVAKHPLSSRRIKLIENMDEVTQSSKLVTNMTMASLEQVALIAAEGCSSTADKIKRVIAQNRPAIEKVNRSNTEVTLAFIYRDVSDDDLASYLKLNSDKDSKWLQGITQNAVEKQFKTSLAKGVQGLKKIFRAHAPKRTMFAPKCGQSLSPEDEAATQVKVANHSSAGKPRHHYAHGRDLRHCLDLPTNAQIIACTEK